MYFIYNQNFPWEPFYLSIIFLMIGSKLFLFGIGSILILDYFFKEVEP